MRSRARVPDDAVSTDASDVSCSPAEIVAGDGEHPMRHSGEKVHGPYQHGVRWRLVRKIGDRQEVTSFATEAEAKRSKRELLKEIQGRSVSDAVQDHIVAKRELGFRKSTITRAEFHLRRFFQLDAEVDGKPMPFANAGGLLEDLTTRRCADLYAALMKDVAVDTHRNALSAAKLFGSWCVDKGWIATNPVAGVKPVGERNRGKKQLRIDEARKLVDLCIVKANAGDDAAVGVLTALLLGMRASEITDRVVRDLDDDGRLLWIEHGKTKRSRRTLEVPALLRPYLLAMAKGRAPDAPLFGRRATKRGNKRGRFWLLHWLHKYCDEAKVPVVCTHSLRGLHATLATEAGATSHVVAGALGHSSPAVTHAHYIDGATARRATARRAANKLRSPTGERTGPVRLLVTGNAG
jgi:integrase